jgi:hypothetical protein
MAGYGKIFEYDYIRRSYDTEAVIGVAVDGNIL